MQYSPSFLTHYCGCTVSVVTFVGPTISQKTKQKHLLNRLRNRRKRVASVTEVVMLPR